MSYRDRDQGDRHDDDDRGQDHRRRDRQNRWSTSGEQRSWEGGGRGGERGYGEASDRAYGEGGYPDQRGRGGYGPQGYGAHQRSEDDREARRVGGPTYSDRQHHLAQRSHWREDQRYGDHRSTGETYERGGQRREGEYGGVDPQAQYDAGRRDHDHEPHYRQWREQQLSAHDRDYARWREQKASGYDTEYRDWRQQRHDSFANDFHNWRSAQGAGGASGQPKAAATRTATEEVQSVTDGHGRAHTRDDDDGR